MQRDRVECVGAGREQELSASTASRTPTDVDIWVGEANLDSEMGRLTASGARFLHRGQQGPHHSITMADPEGNEFCIS